MKLLKPLSVKEEGRMMIGATPTETSVRKAVMESGALPHLPQRLLTILMAMDAEMVGRQLAG
jgi:hypothetical protein